VTYLPISMATPAAAVRPGRPLRMIGTVGPNTGRRPITVSIEGRLPRGALYRNAATTAGSCEVTRLLFRCTAILRPGRDATLVVNVLPDAVRSPRRIVQRMTTIRDGTTANALTSVITVAREPGSATDALAAQITSTPGPTLIVLALFLFALAATVTRRRHQSQESSR
jgi:hypothetical protein